MNLNSIRKVVCFIALLLSAFPFSLLHSSLYSNSEEKGISEALLSLIPKNRVVLPKPLSEDGLKTKADQLLQNLAKRVSASPKFSGLKLSWDDELLSFIKDYNYSSESGVKYIRENIEQLIENTLMDAILTKKIGEESSLSIKISPVKKEGASWSLNFKNVESNESFELPVRATSHDSFSKKLSRDEIKHLLKMSDRLKENLVGQDEVVDQIAKALLYTEQRKTLSKDLSKAQKATVFPFLGPTSTGKTELGKLIAKELFGSKEQATVIDFSKVTSIDDLKELIYGSIPVKHVSEEELLKKELVKDVTLPASREVLRPEDVSLKALEKRFKNNGLCNKILSFLLRKS